MCWQGWTSRSCSCSTTTSSSRPTPSPRSWRSFAEHDDALFAAPQCWSFDGRTYEGMRTRVRTRFGLVQGMCRVPGHEALVDRPDLTAAAGPVLAVDRAPIPGAGGLRPALLPGPDRGPGPGLPGLDGRLEGVLRARIGGLSPRLRHVRAGLRPGGLRSPGRAEQPDLRLEEPIAGAGSPRTWPGSRSGCCTRWPRGGRRSPWPWSRPWRGSAGSRAARRALVNGLGRAGWSARQEAFFRQFRW